MIICIKCRARIDCAPHNLGCPVTQFGMSDDAYARLLDKLRGKNRGA